MESFCRNLCFLVTLGLLVVKASGQDLTGWCPGWNEYYSTCGTACPKTCANYNENFACAAVCVEGCFCFEGYVRDPYGNCILPWQCPQTGGICWDPNEEYLGCKRECVRTCENYDQDIACTADCVPGCYCKIGYVRDAYGNCILPWQCPPKVLSCPRPNEYYDRNGPFLEASCDNGCLSQKPPTKSGCFCVNGYVRQNVTLNEPKPPCVRRETCNPPCFNFPGFPLPAVDM